jgi:hypothetical protein
MSRLVQPDASPAGSGSEIDRRDGIRHDARKLGQVTARLIGGSEVMLVNFSNRGVLFECDSRLLIGARASVRITTTDASVMVTGKVVRSRVKGLVSGALRYDAALALDEQLTLAVPDDPEPAPAEPLGLAADAAPEWQGDPAIAEDAREAPAPTGDDPGLVQLFATVPHDLAELRRLANDNQW